MAFDLTTVASVFAYGNSAGTATDPVDEASVMADLVTAMSRAIEVYCSMTFCAATRTHERVRGLVDAEGVLSAWLAVPTVDVITAAAWRRSASAAWVDLADAGALDIEEHPFGSVVRVLDRSYLGYRGSRLELRLSYTGGWTSLAAVPPDFEWAMRALCWWAYQKRSAPSEKTAIPELGVLIIPQAWPLNVKAMFKNYVRQVPM